MSSAPTDTDPAWLSAKLESLCEIHRPSASEGERLAAQWLVRELAEVGVDGARVEEESGANGTYWWPLGLLAGVGVAAGLAALHGGRIGRVFAAAAGATASALATQEMPPGDRTFRKLLPNSTAYQVLAEIGPADAERTVVLMAHHDTAHSGAIFSPAIPELVARIDPSAFERSDTSPPLMYPVVGGPGVVAVGALLGSRLLTKLGLAISAGTVAAMADIGSRDAVPGANDNGTAVITMLALARELVADPTENVKVMLLSTSEEALCEGMGLFMERHAHELPTDSTFFLSVDTVGSPHLTVLRGEGMLAMKDYPAESLALADGLAEDLGIKLVPNLRLRNATDGVFPLNMDYQCISMASVTDMKQPSNYHWPTDLPENVDYGTVGEAISLTRAIIRRLDQDWVV